MESSISFSSSLGALIRTDFSPKLETALVPMVPTTYRRGNNLNTAVSRLGMKPLGASDNGLGTALSGLLPLPPGTSVQVSYTSEGNRYDKLKCAAEEMIREQISTRTERDISVRYIMRFD